MTLKYNRNTLMAKINQAAKAGVDEAMRVVEHTAVQRAPVRDNFLRNSVHVEPGLVKSGYYQKRISFNRVYAAVQHERTDFNHPRGGQAKYLESALTDPGQVAMIKQIIGNHMKAAL